MTRKMSRPVLLIVLLCCSFAATGCTLLVLGAGAAAGAGTAIYYQGWLEQTLDVPLQQAHQGALNALTELELPVLVDRRDLATGWVESEYADHKRVWIGFEAQSKDRTRARIRVGLVGDKERSLRILELLKKHAGA